MLERSGSVFVCLGNLRLLVRRCFRKSHLSCFVLTLCLSEHLMRFAMLEHFACLMCLQFFVFLCCQLGFDPYVGVSCNAISL